MHVRQRYKVLALELSLAVAALLVVEEDQASQRRAVYKPIPVSEKQTASCARANLDRSNHEAGERPILAGVNGKHASRS